jgi:ubiquinone/menaquinone biosynthesis C-methylase UbiE
VVQSPESFVAGSDTQFYDASWSKWTDMKQFGPMSRHVRRLSLEILKKLDFMSVLDAGCGEGSFLSALKVLRPELLTSGVDISSVAIEHARKLLPDTTFYVADLAQEVIEKTFDLVTAIDVIEHIPDDLSFLRTIRRMTDKYFFVCTLIGKMRPFEKRVGHVRNYTEKGLIEKMHASGFRVVLVKKWGFPFYSPLYRNILQYLPESAYTGKFSFSKKISSALLYFLFKFNLSNRGDVIFMLAEAI